MYLVVRKTGNLYGVVDSGDGIIEDYNEAQIAEFKKRGISILGATRVGIHIISLTHLFSLIRDNLADAHEDAERKLRPCIDRAVATAPSGTSLMSCVDGLFRNTRPDTEFDLETALIDFQFSLNQEDDVVYDDSIQF